MISERPVITYMTGDTTVIIHSEELTNITFTCNATGLPDLTVLWYHNGERVVSNEDYSIFESPTDGAVSSRLIMSDPRLSDSGTITCRAKVSFRADTRNNSRGIETSLAETTRNIIILGMYSVHLLMVRLSMPCQLSAKLHISTDTSPSVTVTVTKDSDLLVRISLGDTVLHQPVKLYLKFTSRETEETFLVRPDSRYSNLSVIYHFIPASQVPNGYRRFWLQVSLVVDNEVGPYNPPVLTSPLITGKYTRLLTT